MDLSLVIPLYNEEFIIDKLYQRVSTSLEELNCNFEIICVDDGSSDATLSKLINIHLSDKRLKVIELSRNFGHQAAYTAGLSLAKGKYVAMMDGDLQDPPELIPSMVKSLETGSLDVVFGRRTARNEKLIKKKSILLFHKFFSKISGINAPANVGNFSVMNRQALNAFLSLTEKNRYLPGLRHFIGFRQGFVDYERPDRTDGEAKMSFKKLVKLAFDAIFSFSDLPLKLAFIFGAIGLLFSIAGSAIVIYKKIIGVAISGWTSSMLSLFFFGSIQLIFLGIIGEYIYRIYKETQNRPIYIIRKYYE